MKQTKRKRKNVVDCNNFIINCYLCKLIDNSFAMYYFRFNSDIKMERLRQIMERSFLVCVMLCCSMNMLAQDSLRYENVSCVNPANNDIRDGLVFSAQIVTVKKSKQIEIVIENYPNENEPLKFVFGRTTNLGSGKVTWMSTGSASLTREKSGTRWVFLFGAPSPEKSVVPCRISKVTSFGQENLPFQLAFAPGQVEEFFSFLKNAAEQNIISQSKL